MTSVPSELYHHQAHGKCRRRNVRSHSSHLVDPYQQATNSKLLTTSMNNINAADEITSVKSQRELGIIEKLCSTYGFVYCCHRDGRYFFHFSEYKNDIHQAKIGGRSR